MSRVVLRTTDLPEPDWDDPRILVRSAEVLASIEFERAMKARADGIAAAKEVKAVKASKRKAKANG